MAWTPVVEETVYDVPAGLSGVPLLVWLEAHLPLAERLGDLVEIRTVRVVW